MKCNKCKIDGKEREKVYNGLKHTEVYCPECDRHITFKSRPLDQYQMPFGKHKGKTLSDLAYEYPDYLYWCVDNLDNKTGNKIREFLDTKGKVEVNL